MSYTISADQLQTLREFAESLDRLFLVSDQISMPPAFHLRQIGKELPEISLRMKALVATIQGQDTDEVATA